MASTPIRFVTTHGYGSGLLRRLMKLRKYLPLALALASIGTPARSEELSYADFLSRVWARSSQLEARDDQRVIAENDRWRRFVPNEPQAFYISQDNGGWQQIGLVLNTPFPGKSFLMMGADRANARAAQHEQAATRLELTQMATEAYLACASARISVELHRKNVEDLRTFSRMLDRLYERGESTQAETLAASLQMRQQESDLAILEGKLPNICARLEAFGLSDVIALELPRDVPVDVVERLGEVSADFHRSEKAIESASALETTARWKGLPDLTLSALDNRYFVNGSSPVGLPHTYSLQVNLTLPVFFLFDELPDTRRQLAEARVARDQAEIARRLATSSMREAAAEFRQVSKRIEMLEKNDIPLAEAMMQSSLSAYRAGKLGFAELMFSRRLYVDLRDQRVQLLGNRVQLRLKCLRRCEGENSGS